MCHFSCAGSNLAALDGGITPLPLASVPQLSRLHEESMRLDAFYLVHSIHFNFQNYKSPYSGFEISMIRFRGKSHETVFLSKLEEILHFAQSALIIMFVFKELVIFWLFLTQNLIRYVLVSTIRKQMNRCVLRYLR